MRNSIAIKIKHIPFPSQISSDAEKQSKDFGLKVGQAIQYEWFKKDNGSCRYYSQRSSFQQLRLYARGEQSVQKYKNELAIDGDLSYLNLDWTPVPIIPKFIDILVNGMSDRLFKVKAYAQDAMSQAKRNKYQDTIEAQMYGKPVLSKIQELTGVNPFLMDPNALPETDEELALYMQLYYKPAIEIAEEEAINTLFDSNHYDDIRKRIDYDIATIGIGMAKHEFMQGQGVKISYVDPANVVYSYTEDLYFKDCFYWGEVKTVSLTELIKINPKLTKEDLEEISICSGDWHNSYKSGQEGSDSLFYKDTCTLLYFNYKSSNKVVYKKKMLDKGRARFIEKDENFNPPAGMMDEGNFEKIEKDIDVWYEGVMVMGSNILLQWRLSENMVRPKSASQYALPNYVATAPRMYKGNIESICRRMIPYADLIQITHLKLQQVIAKVVPDGVFIDADGLNEIDLGTGNKYNPEDALRLYFQTGSVIGRSRTEDGDFNNSRIPIAQLTSNSGSGKTQMLIANMNHYINMIRSVTGLNDAVDGSSPNPKALVGLQKLAALSSNTATRHLLDSSLFIYRSLAEALTYRIGDILMYSDFKEEFTNQIGRYNVSLLNEIKELYLYDFGIFIDISPDEEQRAQLNSNIETALSKGDINLEDAIDIREIHNLKVANQLLKLKRVKNQARAESALMQKQAIISQQQLKSQEIAAQVAMQKIEAETNSKIRVKEAEVAFDIKRSQQEALLKSQLMREEFEYNLRLNNMQVGKITERDQMKEDAKSKRISQQNTEQSRLINQRKNNLPPVTFESNEDSLDGFDFSEFDPR